MLERCCNNDSIISREGRGIGDAEIVEARPIPSQPRSSKLSQNPFITNLEVQFVKHLAGNFNRRHVLDVRYPIPVLLR